MPWRYLDSICNRYGSLIPDAVVRDIKDGDVLVCLYKFDTFNWVNGPITVTYKCVHNARWTRRSQFTIFEAIWSRPKALNQSQMLLRYLEGLGHRRSNHISDIVPSKTQNFDRLVLLIIKHGIACSYRPITTEHYALRWTTQSRRSTWKSVVSKQKVLKP